MKKFIALIAVLGMIAGLLVACGGGGGGGGGEVGTTGTVKISGAVNQ